jgi:nicotinate-nucleotide adenylyltransferase
MQKVGLFFGTFNPIHIGHLALASYICDATELQEVWFVVTPQNPFKQKDNLLDDRQRLHMVNIAIEDNPKFKSSDIEFNLPKPSYTVHTLAYLREKFSDKQFSLIIGQDNLRTFHKWYNHDEIISNHSIICYPRVKQSDNEPLEYQYKGHPNISLVDAPVLNLSASFIRECIQKSIDTQYFLPLKVYQYLSQMQFYSR